MMTLKWLVFSLYLLYFYYKRRTEKRIRFRQSCLEKERVSRLFFSFCIVYIFLLLCSVKAMGKNVVQKINADQNGAQIFQFA